MVSILGQTVGYLGLCGMQRAEMGYVLGGAAEVKALELILSCLCTC